MSAATKQMRAVVAGGIAGALSFVGLSLLLYRRVFGPRIRLTSHPTDIAILCVLWVQLVVGLITLPFSPRHAGVMLILADWAQRIVTLRPVDATALAALAWPYQFHIVFGMTIFLLFPFNCLVHVWSGFGTVRFLFRSHQVVCSRRLNVPGGDKQPREPGAV
jgi:nitrate reductase gamma subunit